MSNTDFMFNPAPMAQQPVRPTGLPPLQGGSAGPADLGVLNLAKVLPPLKQQQPPAPQEDPPSLQADSGAGASVSPPGGSGLLSKVLPTGVVDYLSNVAAGIAAAGNATSDWGGFAAGLGGSLSAGRASAAETAKLARDQTQQDIENANKTRELDISAEKKATANKPLVDGGNLTEWGQVQVIKLVGAYRTQLSHEAQYEMQYGVGGNGQAKLDAIPAEVDKYSKSVRAFILSGKDPETADALAQQAPAPSSWTPWAGGGANTPPPATPAPPAGPTATDPNGNRVIFQNGHWVPYGH